MTAQPVLPDVEDVVIAYLTPLIANTRFCTNLPDDLETVVPLIQVRRVSGAVFGRRYDRAFFDLNAVTVLETDASALARQAEALLLGPVNASFPELGAVLGPSESVIRPRWLPYPNTKVRLYGATYSAKLRSA